MILRYQVVARPFLVLARDHLYSVWQDLLLFCKILFLRHWYDGQAMELLHEPGMAGGFPVHLLQPVAWL